MLTDVAMDNENRHDEKKVLKDKKINETENDGRGRKGRRRRKERKGNTLTRVGIKLKKKK